MLKLNTNLGRLFIIALTWAGHQCHAQSVLVSNLDGNTIPATFGIIVGRNNQVHGAQEIRAAAGFTTGNNSAGYSLSSVTIGLNVKLGDPVGFRLDIHGAVSSNLRDGPGALLGSLSGPEQPALNVPLDYTSPGVRLDPNTTYFVVASLNHPESPPDTWYAWALTPAIDEQSIDDWTIADHTLSSPDGGDWGFGSNVPIIEVTATIVPEPTTYAVTTAGVLGGFAIWRKRRSRSIDSIQTKNHIPCLRKL